MKNFKIIVLCLVAFVFCSGFAASGSTWNKIYASNRKEEMDKGVSCTYTPAENKVGNLKFVSFSADKTNFQINANFDFGTNLNLVVAHSDSPNSAINTAAFDGTNIITIKDFSIGSTICPTTLYIYEYNGFYSGANDIMEDENGINIIYDIRTTTSRGGTFSKYVSNGKTNWDYRENHIDTNGNVIDNKSGKVVKPYTSSIDDGYQFDSDYGYSNMDCGGLLGSPNNANNPAYWLQLALEIMRYAAIIALVGLSIADFVKAITQQDQDALKKAIQTTIKRAIYAVMIFFIPIIVELIMNFFGVYGTCSL